MVTTLLYTDDAVLLAENEEQVKRGCGEDVADAFF